MLIYWIVNDKMTNKANILIIYTGGTIGMIKDYETNALKAFDFSQIIEKIPELNQLNCTINTISFDIDPVAVEKNYLMCLQNQEQKILPLILDLTNPSPSIGWDNNERMSISQRGPVDAVFALALIHHLTISNNIPFNKFAEFFSKICKFLIIEFIPKSDSQVQRLLLTREDIFDDFDQEHFEDEFLKFFKILKSEKILESERIIYIMEKNLNKK